MDAPKKLAFTYGRRFGVEIELNSFDNRNFKDNPLAKGELPKGIEYVGQKVLGLLGEEVEIKKWHLTHHNAGWVIKPDSSCGMEVCSPPSRGWKGLKSLLKVVEGIGKDKKIPKDNRCSLHVHVEIEDFNNDQLESFLAHYIKSEMMFMDLVPPDRKRNRYCQVIGLSDIVTVEEKFNYSTLLKKLGTHKYLTFNVYHYKRGNRKTVEFRIIGNEGCFDPYLIKNWVRFIVHFVEMCKRRPSPPPYEPGDPWSGLAWLDPEQVFDLLGFNGDHPLSTGLEQTRNWLLARMHANMMSDLPGVWSKEAKAPAYQQVVDMAHRFGLGPDDLVQHLAPTDSPQALYAEQYRI